MLQSNLGLRRPLDPEEFCAWNSGAPALLRDLPLTPPAARYLCKETCW